VAKAQVNPHRITQEIRHKIDEAKMDGSMTCELPDAQFKFLFAEQSEDFGYWEDVKVIRAGQAAAVEARESKTEEDLVAEEAEISRQRRAALEAQPGRLKRPNDPGYNPKVKPE
jgi:hypothetical protein